MTYMMTRLSIMKTMTKNNFKFNRVTTAKASYSSTQELIISTDPVFLVTCVCTSSLVHYTRKKRKQQI